MSRPAHVPPGDAYRPEVDTVAAAKQIVKFELHPTKIRQEQANDLEITHLMMGKHSPKIKIRQISFDGVEIICETSTGTNRPVLPRSLRSAAFQACHDIDHAGQAETKRRLTSSYFWPKMKQDTSFYVKSCHPC